MKEFFKKYWPSVAHLVAVGIIFLAPSVHDFLLSHPDSAAGLGAIWGIALHWATSPKSN